MVLSMGTYCWLNRKIPLQAMIIESATHLNCLHSVDSYLVKFVFILKWTVGSKLTKKKKFVYKEILMYLIPINTCLSSNKYFCYIMQYGRTLHITKIKCSLELSYVDFQIFQTCSRKKCFLGSNGPMWQLSITHEFKNYHKIDVGTDWCNHRLCH